MARNRSLVAMTVDEIEAVLRHPAQLEACAVISELIGALRALDSQADYLEFQRILFGHAFAAQKRRGEAARNVKRQEAGRPIPQAPVSDWEIERRVWHRIGRQFQSVGDALAWRCFNFDRRFLLVLSSNSPPGPMPTKEGLNYELGEVLEIWKRERCFALLHDLTSAFRIADLTKFTENGPLLVEVKAGGKKIPASQMRRMQRAVDAINKGGALPGRDDVGVFASSQQFKTHLKHLKKALDQADQQGFAFAKLGDQWVVSALSVGSPHLPPAIDFALNRYAEEEARHLETANLTNIRHRLVSASVERPGVHPAVAPFTIYPFEPEVCARLTCDLLTYKTMVGWERLSRAFENEGFATECPLPERTGDLEQDAPVLVAKRGSSTVTIPGFALGQLLGELINQRRFAAAVHEIVDLDWKWPSGVITFANEKAVWR